MFHCLGISAEQLLYAHARCVSAFQQRGASTDLVPQMPNCSEVVSSCPTVIRSYRILFIIHSSASFSMVHLRPFCVFIALIGHVSHYSTRLSLFY